jgi:hypothetical protein
MDYLPDDYDQLYGQQNTSNKVEGWSMVGWLICLVIVAALLGGCDGQAAEATYESVMNSQAKKEELPPGGRVNSYLLSQPVGTTWVEQSGNDGRGKQMKPIRRYTPVADLTERK